LEKAKADIQRLTEPLDVQLGRIEETLDPGLAKVDRRLSGPVKRGRPPKAEDDPKFDRAAYMRAYRAKRAKKEKG
jgi:hypothetical protein